MPELAKPDLEELTTELLIAFRPKLCRVEQCPNLSGPTFGLVNAALGQLIYIVPESISNEEAAKQFDGGQGFHIVSDCRAGEVLHLCLASTIEWRQKMRELLTRQHSDLWEIAFVERCGADGQARFGLLRASQDSLQGADDEDEADEKRSSETLRDVWMAPVQRRIVAGCTKKVVKKKVLRKVARKSSREEESPNNSSGQKTPVGTHGVNGDSTVPADANGKAEGREKDNQAPLQNGHIAHKNPSSAPNSPKLNGTTEKGGGTLVSRMATIFGGGTANGAPRSTRGRSQSLEEPTNGLKDGNLKRADSEGSSGSNSKEGTPLAESGRKKEEPPKSAMMPEKTAQLQGGYMRIPVQLNGSSPPPETKAPKEDAGKNEVNGIQNGKGHGHILANGQSNQLVNGSVNVAVEKAKIQSSTPTSNSSNTTKTAPPPIPTKPPTSLQISTNRPSVESTPPKDSPPSPISPPSMAGSDSPNSFHSARGESPLLTSIRHHRWRREDAPSPSTSLAQNVTIRRASGTQNGMTGASRLGPPLGSMLSPISSCGSVEAKDHDGIDEDHDDADEEDESTLMLLHRDRISAGRSTLGAENDDELSCSLDFSLASISQKVPAPEPPVPLPSTTLAMAGIRPTARTMVRRVQSPSPPKQAVSLSPAPHMVRGMIGSFRMPVPVLQQIIGLMSFKEMGELRRVHPHWDELCGQLLNAGHSQLLHRAQHLLTDCQRRVHREPRMAQPVQLLTRLHVHVLNPVDGMRAFMDEGVLCFPYGALLDNAFAMIFRVEEMIERSDTESNEARERDYDDASNQMDSLADLARRAALHYRQWVEPEAEKRMSELYRASAQQRLQRLDSFLVESSVSRVERDAEKARTELSWEMEQLRQQNTQLKKENRELKQLCQRLDQRVDVLERKFKTMARLLQ